MPTRDLFSAIADPTRRQILDLLCQREMGVGELVETLGLAQPNVSKHLRTLGEAELVHVRVDGPRRHYRLRPDRLQELEEWLAPYRRMWADRLDALERHLDQLDDPDHERTER